MSFLLSFSLSGHTTWLSGPYFPDQGSNSCPLQWNCGVLSTRMPSEVPMSPFHVSFFHFPTTASVTRQVLTLSLPNLLFSKFVNNLLIPPSRGAFSMPTSPSSVKAFGSSSYGHLSPLTSGQFLSGCQFLTGTPNGSLMPPL